VLKKIKDCAFALEILSAVIRGFSEHLGVSLTNPICAVAGNKATPQTPICPKAQIKSTQPGRTKSVSGNFALSSVAPAMASQSTSVPLSNMAHGGIANRR
jgi:hypothetical protein